MFVCVPVNIKKCPSGAPGTNPKDASSISKKRRNIQFPRLSTFVESLGNQFVEEFPLTTSMPHTSRKCGKPHLEV
jgi:hypothetical protein